MSEVEKVRSAEKEADLDKKIQEIRRRNEELEERHKIVTEEAKQNGVPKSFQKATVNNGGGQHKSGSNHTNLKTSETIPSPKKGNGVAESKGNQWSREWDRGKTSAEDWKMNVPEFGDHGNSYFKTESANGGNSATTRGGRRDSGGRGGLQHQQQRGGGGRRPGAQGSKPQTPHNPGFFHDDRFDVKAKSDENGTDSAAAAPPSSNDGKQQTEGHHKKFPPRNNNNPRKPATMNKSFENDKNQNDSSKPNMNVSNGFGPRQDRREGSTQQPPRNSYNQHPRRDGAAPASGGGGNFRQQPHHNGFNKDAQKNSESQRKPPPKTEGGKPQNIKDANNVQDKQQRSGPSSNRGRNFKPFNKPANYSNPRQNKVPSQKFSNSNNGTTKPQNPKLDKDGQAVKRLIDNIIDQVVRQERKEQKKNEGVEEEENVENQSNGVLENGKSDNQENEKSNEEANLEAKEKSENNEIEEKKDEKQKESNVNEKRQSENETKVESKENKNLIPEGNSNEIIIPTDSATAKTNNPESQTENKQEQQQQQSEAEQQQQQNGTSENQPEGHQQS